MPESQIPKATAKRLPVYQRAFRSLNENEKEKVSSQELSELVKIDSTTIRRDFSYLGTLGRRGYGYDVSELNRFFDQLLNRTQIVHVALVGVGNLGEALLKENVRSEENIRITVGFDIREDLTDTVKNGIPIYSMDDIAEQIPHLGIKTAILTVPNQHAQAAVNQLVEAGIEGILNFTTKRLNIPKNVRIRNVDLGNELQILNYFMENNIG